MKSIQKGSPRPLGATCSKRGVNFALFSSAADRVEVCLYDETSGEELSRHELPGRTGNTWHGMVSSRRARPGTPYAFRV